MRFTLIVLMGLLAFVLTSCPKPTEDTGTPAIEDQNMRKPDFGKTEATPPPAAGPVAALLATPTGGPSPLAVNFDAASSSDPSGTIVKYEFDPESTGKWVDNGNSPQFSYTYNANGTFTALVKVTNDKGESNTATVTINVGGEGTPPPAGSTTPPPAAPPAGGTTPPPAAPPAEGGK